MDLKALKDKADECLKKSWGILSVDGKVAPTLYIFHVDGSISPFELENTTEEEKQHAAELMKHLTTKEDVEGLFMVFDTFLAPNKADLPKDLSTYPESMECLLGLLYTPKYKFMRKVYHGGAFMDMGWEELRETSGTFGNPYSNT